jgi:uncharacterized protein YndB with AHSA1/START domain
MVIILNYKQIKLCFLLVTLTVCSASISAQNQPIPSEMETHSFTTTLLFDQPPSEVFAAITNVRAWWSAEIEGGTSQLNDEFTYHYEDVHRVQLKLIEVVANQKVVWLVKNNYFNFTKDKTEWTGTKIIFDISEKDNQTQLRFTHLGLVPEYECFSVCSKGWTFYIQQSLAGLITSGIGQPNGKSNPRTAEEKALQSGTRKQ